MIKLKDLINEIVNGRGYFTKEKFSSVILSELKREFPKFVNIELVKAMDMQQDKHKAFKRADIHNSDLMAIFSVEHNDNEYEVRILNVFKKVPDEELSNKFTMVDDDFLRKMDYKSLEPKDLNQPSPLMVWRARVVKSDEKVLIPKKPGYAILFDDYKTLKEAITDIKKVIDKDSGFGGDVPVNTPDPVVPHTLQPAQ